MVVRVIFIVEVNWNVFRLLGSLVSRDSGNQIRRCFGCYSSTSSPDCNTVPRSTDSAILHRIVVGVHR